MNKKRSIGLMNTLPGNKTTNSRREVLSPGDNIGTYKVIKPLGKGGMGFVYLVENVQIHKLYALKVLPPILSNNRIFVDRFRVEARVMADLKHPSIVNVHHIKHDSVKKLYYLVMEFISGVDSCQLTVDGKESLPTFIRRSLGERGTNNQQPATNPSDLEGLLKEKKKLDESYVLKITKQLCSALEFAHNFRGNGIIHRDLKPSNILLDLNGNAHISDFGLAKVVGSDYLKSMIDRSMRLTIPGNYTPPNMSLGEMKTIPENDSSSPPSSYALRASADKSDLRSSTSGSGGTTGTGLRSSELRPSTAAGSLIGTYEYMSPEQQEGEEASFQSDIYSLGLIVYQMLTGSKAKGNFKLPSEYGVSKYWDIIISRSLKSDPVDRFNSVSEIIVLLQNITNENKVNIHKYKRFFAVAAVIIIAGLLLWLFWEKTNPEPIAESISQQKSNPKTKTEKQLEQPEKKPIQFSVDKKIEKSEKKPIKKGIETSTTRQQGEAKENPAEKPTYKTREKAVAKPLVIEKSLKKENPEAMYKRGVMYLNGEGIPKSINKALIWLKRAAENGNDSAYLTLGNIYFYGRSVVKDRNQAFKYYSSAAEMENLTAMGLLGKCYYYGYGTGKNRHLAREWFYKASEKGNRYAENFIKSKF